MLSQGNQNRDSVTMHLIKNISKILRHSSQTYDEEFSAAARLGKIHKLDVPFITPCDTRYLNNQTLKEVNKLFVQYSEFPDSSWVTKIVRQCIATHFLLLDGVEQVFRSKPAFTLGWIEAGRDRFFECNRNDVLSWLKHGVPDPTKVNLHAWLTLQSMEVIDFTFVPSYIIIYELPIKHLGFDVGHWTEFSTNRRHHPIIVGNDLPKRLGLLRSIITPP